MADVNADAVARRVARLMHGLPVGTVVTVLVDGSVVIDGATEVRDEWEWPEERLISFVVIRVPPSQETIRQRIAQALESRP